MAFREWTAIQDALERRIIIDETCAIQHVTADRTDADAADASDFNRLERWSQLGIYTPHTLNLAVEREARQPYLVDGLLRTRSLNLLIGDSGLGKTPLAIQLGLCVAAGVPMLGKAVQQGTVLYCDAESSQHGFNETLATISRYLGCNEPPESFGVWSPNWGRGRDDALSDGSALIELVTKVRPSLVIVDALRTFWPHAEGKNQDAAETYKHLKKVPDVTWLILHHKRKVNQAAGGVDLVENPQLWCQEASGALALVNQSDTRFGLIPHPRQGDLLLSGFIRGSGPMTPLDLGREIDDEGNPLGYKLLTGAEHLSVSDRGVFEALPVRFRFKDVTERMGGNSGSNPARLLKKCESLNIVHREGKEYVKTALKNMERVERVGWLQ
jgi:hypothetical protein